MAFDSIKEAFAHTSLTTYDLWVIYYSLGGTANSDELKAYLVADGRLDASQERVLAQSLNEIFIDADENHPVPYPVSTLRAESSQGDRDRLPPRPRGD